MSSEKSAKTKISRRIVHAIHCQSPPGRFLERDPKLDTWIEVGEKRTLEKITQALREKRKKCTFEETNSNRQEDSDIIPFENDLSVSSANRRKSFSPNMSSNLPLQTEKNEHPFVSVSGEDNNQKFNTPSHTTNRAKKREQSKSFDFLDIPCHEWAEKETGKVDQDEINYLIHQTFFGMTQVNDILFGRGKGNYNHVGNIKFHKFVNLCKVSEFMVEL